MDSAFLLHSGCIIEQARLLRAHAGAKSTRAIAVVDDYAGFVAALRRRVIDRGGILPAARWVIRNCRSPNEMI
jgi:hypothetical protein